MLRSTKSFVWQDGAAWKLTVARPDDGHMIFDLPDCLSENDARLDAAALLSVETDRIIVAREDFIETWDRSKWKTFAELCGEPLVNKSTLTNASAIE
jgi:hypothetical protein